MSYIPTIEDRKRTLNAIAGSRDGVTGPMLESLGFSLKTVDTLVEWGLVVRHTVKFSHPCLVGKTVDRFVARVP